LNIYNKKASLFLNYKSEKLVIKMAQLIKTKKPMEKRKHQFIYKTYFDHIISYPIYFPHFVQSIDFLID